ncbi:DUF805 domain-containing protein, partial [Acinetobacter baumannii]|uniref:DUF805 domain-containing protein n=1 Tax=Acinetobacter baumannii TaxID=470 RepID=UPI0039924D6D
MCTVLFAIIKAIGISIIKDGSSPIVLFIFYIPLLWFNWAQGAKRSHDIGNSGWWQLIPLYGFWLLFADGQVGSNQYGNNPKNLPATQQSLRQSAKNNSGTDYQGGYTGGHNNPNANYYNQPQPNNCLLYT